MKTPNQPPAAKTTASPNTWHTAIEFYGPATVLQTEPGRAYLEMPDAYVWAELATGWFYEPSPGDRVLAIGGAQGWYVIGVLEAGATQRVVLPGSLELAAPSGSITLRATGEVAVKGRAFRVFAREAELTAHRIWERCESLIQKVRGALRVEAGSSEHHINGEAATQAGRIRTTAVGDIKLRGKTINLN